MLVSYFDNLCLSWKLTQNSYLSFSAYCKNNRSYRHAADSFPASLFLRNNVCNRERGFNGAFSRWAILYSMLDIISDKPLPLSSSNFTICFCCFQQLPEQQQPATCPRTPPTPPSPRPPSPLGESCQACLPTRPSNHPSRRPACSSHLLPYRAS